MKEVIKLTIKTKNINLFIKNSNRFYFFRFKIHIIINDFFKKLFLHSLPTKD